MVPGFSWKITLVRLVVEIERRCRVLGNGDWGLQDGKRIAVNLKLNTATWDVEYLNGVLTPNIITRSGRQGAIGIEKELLRILQTCGFLV